MISGLFSRAKNQPCCPRAEVLLGCELDSPRQGFSPSPDLQLSSKISANQTPGLVELMQPWDKINATACTQPRSIPLEYISSQQSFVIRSFYLK